MTAKAGRPSRINKRLHFGQIGGKERKIGTVDGKDFVCCSLLVDLPPEHEYEVTPAL